MPPFSLYTTFLIMQSNLDTANNKLGIPNETMIYFYYSSLLVLILKIHIIFFL